MSREVKCRIKKYDPNVTEPPLEFITLDEFTCQDQDENDDGGVEFYYRLLRECIKKGYSMRFYSMSSEDGYDYDITVRG